MVSAPGKNSAHGVGCRGPPQKEGAGSGLNSESGAQGRETGSCGSELTLREDVDAG